MLRSAEQFKALEHPVRHRVVNVLRQRPATLRQLADVLGMRKGTVGYHVRVLREAGLVRLAGTRQVRGGTEQYFALVSHGFKVHQDAAVGPEFLINAALGEMLPDLPGSTRRSGSTAATSSPATWTIWPTHRPPTGTSSWPSPTTPCVRRRTWSPPTTGHGRGSANGSRADC